MVCKFPYKHLSFSQVTPFGVLGVVLKRTGMFVLWWWWSTLSLLGFVWPTGYPDGDSPGDSPGDGDSPGVDGTQVGVFKETHKIGLCCFLKTHYGC